MKNKMGEGVLKVLFTIPIGKGIPVRVAVVEMWGVMAFLIILAFYLTSNMKLVPSKKQVIAEFIVDSINKITKNFLGHYWHIFAPYLGTLFLFLLGLNLLGLIGLQPPTSNLNVTASFGVMSILVLIISTIVLKNPIRWFLSHFKPILIIFPFKFLDYFTRTLSLSARLFGNILAGVTIMELVYHGLIKAHIPPVGIPAALSLYFDIFDGILQAVIFAFLSLIYLYEALEE